MNVPGGKLHPLKGADLQGHWSAWVNGNLRLPLTFEGQDAILVDYQDYHHLAIRLAKWIPAPTAIMWLQMQADYDLWQAEHSGREWVVEPAHV